MKLELASLLFTADAQGTDALLADVSTTEALELGSRSVLYDAVNVGRLAVEVQPNWLQPGVYVGVVSAGAAANAEPARGDAIVATAASKAVTADRRINAEAILGTPFADLRLTTQRRIAKKVTIRRVSPPAPG